ncbi:MAG: hypothetical protein JRI22_22960 [Deltaproteobacteria bacterium]|nr:hypothetical protein [Deltaproteobacteria bacterium]
MTDSELVAFICSMRKLVVTFDTIGFPVSELSKDREISKMVRKDLPKRIRSVAADVHSMLQKVEQSKKYKTIILKYHDALTRKEV